MVFSFFCRTLILEGTLRTGLKGKALSKSRLLFFLDNGTVPLWAASNMAILLKLKILELEAILFSTTAHGRCDEVNAH